MKGLNAVLKVRTTRAIRPTESFQHPCEADLGSGNKQLDAGLNSRPLKLPITELCSCSSGIAVIIRRRKPNALR